MGSPAGGALRVFRTVAITAVIVGLAATAHVAGGDEPPRPLGIAGLALVTAYVCAWVVRRRLSLVAITVLLGVGQWLLHHAFELLQAPACAPVAADHAGHAGHAPASGGCLTEAAAGGALATAHAAPSWAMLAAHAVATAVTALLLATGERAVWALCALLVGAAARAAAAGSPRRLAGSAPHAGHGAAAPAAPRRPPACLTAPRPARRGPEAARAPRVLIRTSSRGPSRCAASGARPTARPRPHASTSTRRLLPPI